MCALAVMKLFVAQAGLKETEIGMPYMWSAGLRRVGPQAQANIFFAIFQLLPLFFFTVAKVTQEELTVQIAKLFSFP